LIHIYLNGRALFFFSANLEIIGCFRHPVGSTNAHDRQTVAQNNDLNSSIREIKPFYFIDHRPYHASL
jgi:hypothetical protein